MTVYFLFLVIRCFVLAKNKKGQFLEGWDLVQTPWISNSMNIINKSNHTILSLNISNLQKCLKYILYFVVVVSKKTVNMWNISSVLFFYEHMPLNSTNYYPLIMENTLFPLTTVFASLCQ